MYACEKNNTKCILKLLGNSNWKDDEKGAITALLGFFSSLFQVHYNQERTHLDVFGRGS